MDLPRTPSFRLEGRRALVTGGSRGIGLGAAMALAEAGAHVVVAARGAEELEATVAAMTAEGLSAEAAVLDVTDPAAVEAMLDRVGPVDVLVNSAGMARHGPAVDTLEADYDAVMGVNVKAAYFLAQAVARRMQGPGSIIQISSQMGHVGGIDRAVYCATKHAVEGMTKAMAIEWGARGIRVNTICPTFILTPLTEGTFADPRNAPGSRARSSWAVWDRSRISWGRWSTSPLTRLRWSRGPRCWSMGVGRRGDRGRG
jgi:NAD(P)-dependent dehydrogenase (short-subunit alcohol dehydrogenase family)